MPRTTACSSVVRKQVVTIAADDVVAEATVGPALTVWAVEGWELEVGVEAGHFVGV